MRKILIPRESSPSTQNLINQKYQLLKQIGAGGFSKVYLGINVENNKLLALKTQKIMAKSVVEREGKILADILKKKNVLGIPKLYWHGSSNASHFIALELLGPNLETLWKACNKRFSLKTVLIIGDQMLTRLEFLHKQGYVHGDLKPSNFTIGREHTKDVIYLIDYGLCKLFWNKKTDTHKPYREGQTFQGNTTFASINAHLGIEITRRDDLESLMYVLIYFYKGGFSWDDLDLMEKPQRCARLVDMKTSLPIEILCKGMPEQFMRCLAYCRGLQYDEKPDYQYLRNLIAQAMQKKDFKNDLEFDWFITEKAQQEIDEETIKESRHFRGRGASSQNFTNIITTNVTTDMSEETLHFVGYSTFVNKTVDDPYMGEENEEPGEESGIPISNYRDPSTLEVVMTFPSKACLMPVSCAVIPSNNNLALLKLSKSERQLSRPIDAGPTTAKHNNQEAKGKSTGQFRWLCNTSGENQIEQQEISSVIFEKKSIDSSCWRICK